VVWETEEGWGIRADLAIVEGPVTVGVWEKRVVSGIVAAKVWEIEVLAWVTAGGVSGRELELAQAIVEGSVAVEEGVPSKAPVAEAVMCVAPAPAVPQAVAGEVVATEVVAVVGVVVVAGGAGSGCLYLCQVDWIFAVGGKEDASSNRKLGKSLDE
jgi:hypothetical protein